jgi:hypothetical protein
MLRQLGYTEKIPQTDVIAWYRLNSWFDCWYTAC